VSCLPVPTSPQLPGIRCTLHQRHAQQAPTCPHGVATIPATDCNSVDSLCGLLCYSFKKLFRDYLYGNSVHISCPEFLISSGLCCRLLLLLLLLLLSFSAAQPSIGCESVDYPTTFHVVLVSFCSAEEVDVTCNTQSCMLNMNV